MSKKAKLSQLNNQIEKSPTKTHRPSKKESGIQANPERGERGNFLKITMTLPPAMLGKLRQLGLERKAEGKRDTDVSSLIREAVSLLFDVEKV